MIRGKCVERWSPWLWLGLGLTKSVPRPAPVATGGWQPGTLSRTFPWIRAGQAVSGGGSGHQRFVRRNLDRMPRKLALGACTVLQIVGPANRVNIRGHVLRCEVISVAPANGLLYRVAIAFDPDPCPLPVGSYLSGGADREFPWI